MYHSAASSYHYFRWDIYHPDIHGKKVCNSMPELKKIIHADNYNEEEFLKLFRVHHDCFHAFFRLLKHHAAFLKHEVKQRKRFI